jgi:hypothetical protein
MYEVTGTKQLNLLFRLLSLLREKIINGVSTHSLTSLGRLYFIFWDTLTGLAIKGMHSTIIYICAIVFSFSIT